MQNVTWSGWSLVVMGMVSAACTSSSNATPSNDAGTTPAVDGSTTQGDSAAPGHDSGAAGDDASSTVDDGSVGDDGSTGDDGGTGNDASSGGNCNLDGTWNATAVACNGTPISLNGFSWTAVISGTNGSFTETINNCAYTESGPVTCAGNVLSTARDQPTTCVPASCQPFASQCGVVPSGGGASWTMSQVGATSFVLTSMDEPDGGPTPIKTCTGQGKQNPVQVTWTKQ